jgi:hypothetical protein
MKLSSASAAIAPTAKSRPVLTHLMASVVSSTLKNAVEVGTLGRKFIDGKELMELMSTPCPVEPPTQPLPPLDVKPIEAESAKQNQTATPVPVDISNIPISAQVAKLLFSTTASVITIRPKVRPEVNLASVGHKHEQLVVVLERGHVEAETSTGTIKFTKPPNPHLNLPNHLCHTLSSNNHPQRKCNHRLQSSIASHQHPSPQVVSTRFLPMIFCKGLWISVFHFIQEVIQGVRALHWRGAPCNWRRCLG